MNNFKAEAERLISELPFPLAHPGPTAVSKAQAALQVVRNETLDEAANKAWDVLYEVNLDCGCHDMAHDAILRLKTEEKV